MIPLSLCEENCRSRNRSRLEAIAGAAPSLEGALEFSLQMRKAGIANLFGTGLTATFFKDLKESAQSFARALAGLPMEEKAAGLCHPLLEAWACADAQAVLDIAQSAPGAWNPGKEYPEDFHYFRYLMQAGDAEALADRASGLKEWAGIVGPSSDPRLALCRAIESGDADAFNIGLAELMDGEREEWQERIDSDQALPEDAVTLARLSVEGLALAAVAERRGLKVDRLFPMMPAGARAAFRPAR